MEVIADLHSHLTSERAATAMMWDRVRAEVEKLQSLARAESIPIDMAMATGNTLKDTRQSVAETASRILSRLPPSGDLAGAVRKVVDAWQLLSSIPRSVMLPETAEEIALHAALDRLAAEFGGGE